MLQFYVGPPMVGVLIHLRERLSDSKERELIDFLTGSIRQLIDVIIRDSSLKYDVLCVAGDTQISIIDGVEIEGPGTLNPLEAPFLAYAILTNCPASVRVKIVSLVDSWCQTVRQIAGLGNLDCQIEFRSEDRAFVPNFQSHRITVADKRLTAAI